MSVTKPFFWNIKSSPVLKMTNLRGITIEAFACLPEMYVLGPIDLFFTAPALFPVGPNKALAKIPRNFLVLVEVSIERRMQVIKDLTFFTK